MLPSFPTAHQLSPYPPDKIHSSRHIELLYKKQGSNFVLRLEQGDDILKTLRDFSDTQKIKAAFFEGIGSLYRAKLGHYDFKDTKTYKYETFDEDLEILTLSGNVSTMNGHALPHAHITL